MHKRTLPCCELSVKYQRISFKRTHGVTHLAMVEGQVGDWLYLTCRSSWDLTRCMHSAENFLMSWQGHCCLQNVMDIGGRPWQLEKGTCQIPFPKKAKRSTWGTNGSVSLQTWANHGACPPGTHFWTCEGESDWQEVSGFTNRLLCLINLKQFYDKMMTGFVGMGRASHPIHFDFSLLSKSSLTIFLYPSYDVIVWMGGQWEA